MVWSLRTKREQDLWEDEHPSNTASGELFAAILERRLSRRTLIKGTAGGAAVLTLSTALPGFMRQTAAAQGAHLAFAPIQLSAEDRVTVPEGYTAAVLIRWGDPLVAGLPPFDPRNQSAEQQTVRFGYNCDGIFYYALPVGSSNGNWGLLAINNEYTNPELMFPGFDPNAPTRQQVDVEIAAHGITVVEVRRDSVGAWSYNVGSPYNRRITGETTAMITGPAAGHEWMRTSYDSTGTWVRGTMYNCGQGKTPWGTILTCEENFQSFFGNLDAMPASDPRRAVHQRYGIATGASEKRWELHYDRFDVATEPNEAFRFGWVVEIDPYDPDFTPRKRTALGRFKHEAATTKLTKEGHVAVYTGDDERFEYAYKFVSSGQYDPNDRAANVDLLDDGTLYAARFNDDGSGDWLPLIYGQGPLTSANGFSSQADVLLQARIAASLLGATQMDRPEDFEPNPANGKIYLVMTFNERRTAEQVNAANPRPENNDGHIIEITESNDDAASTTFTWELFLVCGDASKDGTVYCAGVDPSMISPISAPDNIAFDQSGNLWIATDGQIRPTSFRMNDAIFVVPTEGPDRGYLRQFLSGVPGGEVSSLAFASNDETLFACIQHPGEGGKFDDATSRFPDGTLPPRPAVVAVTRTAVGSGTIGA